MNKRAEQSHIFDRHPQDHYVEERWCDDRLFEEEEFGGPILDPCCGWGRVLDAAVKAGHKIQGSDVVHRAVWSFPFRQINFVGTLAVSDDIRWIKRAGSCVGNPPFDQFQEFVNRALELEFDKIAFIWLARRLAAAHWLRETPLRKVLYMTPRPSMPTGEHILKAERGEIDPETGEPFKVGGGKQDFVWLIFGAGSGPPQLGWLHRDEGKHAVTKVRSAAGDRERA